MCSPTADGDPFTNFATNKPLTRPCPVHVEPQEVLRVLLDDPALHLELVDDTVDSNFATNSTSTSFIGCINRGAKFPLDHTS